MVGAYAEIGDCSAPLGLTLPPPPTEDTVHYSTPVLTRVAATSSPPPSSSSGSLPPTEQPIEDSDVHPLGEPITITITGASSLRVLISTSLLCMKLFNDLSLSVSSRLYVQ